MSRIMKINPSGLTAETAPSQSPQYLDREEDKFLRQLESAQVDYKREFGQLNDLSNEVKRIKNSIKLKYKSLQNDFAHWHSHQLHLLDRLSQAL